MIEKTLSKTDSRVRYIRLTETGRREFNRLSDIQNAQIQKIFQKLNEKNQKEILSAMVMIRNKMSEANDVITIRPFTLSNIEYVISRHKTLYYAERHLSDVFSAYVDRIVYEFVSQFNAQTDCLNILECNKAPAGCGNSDSGAATAGSTQSNTRKDAAETDTGSGSAVDAGEEVTIKLFSNLPDRKNGQGLVEQMIIDEYMAANQNVKIEVEALDEEAYKTKFKAYAMDGMPDVVSIWGQPYFLDKVLDAGVLAELNEADYADYGFIAGSLEGFRKDGKLYGLPRNTDIIQNMDGKMA